MNTVYEHLEELTSRLRIVLASVLLGTLVFLLPYRGKLLAVFFLDRIKADLLFPELQLYSFNFFEGIQAIIFVAVALGIIVSLPVISLELYRFIKPALKSEELKYLKLVSAVFVLLFVFGVALGYFFILPLTLRILIEFVRLSGAGLLVSITQFILFVLSTLLLTGFLFTFPVYLVAGIRFGLLEASSLRRNRKFIIVGVLVFTAIITPDPTIVSMLVLSVPVLLLYELSILAGGFLKKKG